MPRIHPNGCPNQASISAAIDSIKTDLESFMSTTAAARLSKAELDSLLAGILNSAQIVISAHHNDLPASTVETAITAWFQQHIPTGRTP